MADLGADLRAGRDYVRFIVLSQPRTGSTLLAQSLNSHPAARCFGEIFNTKVSFIHYQQWGYDQHSADDKALRARAPAEFLRERIFPPRLEGVRAVGFKLMYEDPQAFDGLTELLRDDVGLHVLHLRRRNLLRVLVSYKIVEETGVVFQGDPAAVLGSRLTKANAVRAVRHPLRALKRLREVWPRGERDSTTVTISPVELSEFVEAGQRWAAHYEELFAHHRKLDLFYTDLEDDREPTLERVQTFLGLEPTPLKTTLAKQHPHPLRELINNYDELLAACRGGPYESLFE